MPIEVEPTSERGEDLRRADEAESGGYDNAKATRASIDVMNQSPGNF
jgi:hypothetical protein